MHSQTRTSGASTLLEEYRKDNIFLPALTRSYDSDTLYQEQVVEILGNYEMLRSPWVSSSPVECARLVKHGRWYFVIPFGMEPEGLEYEDYSSGPFATLEEARLFARELLYTL
jgi:hypothetical protein